ncbi:sulfurtransferase complex subunit TusB [Buchnera aphidicola]|nr:sulfurtransferase complex subunit TusB [Buchnera aphidicola]
MLHIITKSPVNFDIQSLFLTINSSDDVLTIQDGVLLSLNNNVYLKQIVKYSVNLYVLYEDISARGLIKQLSNLFIIVRYSEFIELTVKHTKQITW